MKQQREILTKSNALSPSAWLSTASLNFAFSPRARYATAVRFWRSSTYFAQHQSTVLMLDDLTSEVSDRAVHSIAHSVIHLDQLASIYGGERRRLRVVKCRGQSFRGGHHDFTIEASGLHVFPRLVAAEERRVFAGDDFKSGVAELDSLLGGGLARGSSTLVIGPAGTGKSLLVLQFIAAAVARGERAMFVFDEEVGLLLARAENLGIDLQAMCDANQLFIEQMDAAELSPGEFSHRVRRKVEEEQSSVVVIDSLSGYKSAMPEEQFVVLHLHELIQYLNRRSVATFVTLTQHGMIGDMRQSVDMTYIADTVILLRYFEAAGRVRRAISVIKKRSGPHEDTIREFRIDSRTGLTLGPVLHKIPGSVAWRANLRWEGAVPAVNTLHE